MTEEALWAKNQKQRGGRDIAERLYSRKRFSKESDGKRILTLMRERCKTVDEIEKEELEEEKRKMEEDAAKLDEEPIDLEEDEQQD